MTIQSYLEVQNNVVTNIVQWDGETDWIPPENATMLIQATTPAMIWQLNADKTEVSLVKEIGVGDIEFTWDGSVLTTNQPKPPVPSMAQPTSTGTKTA